MSRSGYSDDLEQWALIRWRGAVASALRGARGQQFLREMAQALDALPDKRLAENDIVTKEGEVCALGAVARMRGIDATSIDPENARQVSQVFGIAYAMAAEIEYENDEGCWRETPEQRWVRMRQWVQDNIKAAA